jgi:hypothetical protein
MRFSLSAEIATIANNNELATDLRSLYFRLPREGTNQSGDALMPRFDAIAIGIGLSATATPAFAAVPVPAPVAGVGFGAVLLIGMGYRALKRRHDG